MTKKNPNILDALGGGDVIRAMIREIVTREIEPLAKELAAARRVVEAARELSDVGAELLKMDSKRGFEDLDIALANYDDAVSGDDDHKASC